ncbi:WD repeat and FYVE domain-containing protein 2 [Tetranychus urticae]|uniref:FYVE-type domain-containing protein n=1 Tax=Tetranychus urticae TaxID=32264 RepID=T1KE31_TETUR|nr:WD repeat and FYVE domain-containing protein 2 [Tetranychus urticae]
MSAEIRPFPGSASSNKRLELVAKLEGHQEVVNFAILLKNEEGVISTGDDKSVMIWLKRDTGNYWPSVCHRMPAAGTVMSFNHETKRLFVGMENGSISEFLIADDYNRITHQRTYIAHNERVTGLIFSIFHEWVLSVSKDRYFCWHCSETGNRLGGFQFNSWCTALQFDAESKHTFIGDYTGQITMLKLEGNSYKPITTLKGHSDAIRCLAWDPEKQMLFSGAYDKVIICWDIGGKRGTAYELQGHLGKVTSLCFANQAKLLISSSEDSKVVFWKMDVKRKETPDWLESDYCQRCSRPFFWNIKAMLDQKTIGLRQHHCRRCGKAVCDSCSSNRSVIPIMGFEFLVRICDECQSCISDDDLQSLASSADTKHSIMHMDLDESRSLLMTSGSDRVIKLWDISKLIIGPSQ